MSARVFEPNGRPAADIAAEIDQDLIAPLAEHRRLRPLLLRLLSDLSERLPSARAAKIVSVETKYFSRFFRRETGFKFSWWEREIRVRRAARLLHQKGCNIDSIALAVGYVDVTTFARAFKKSVGVCPQEYRRSRCTPRGIAPPSPGTGLVVTKNADEKTTNAVRSLAGDADARDTPPNGSHR